eukprot:TRINITY_DN2447_c0_g1_i1.p1 TRINITY_DN2447_c0_g1~~TRINITY_DN2447_c0_g1_i1.p1  ORF type:complete len:450 (-),score=139.55 TRINITY_DN2447_c0_g1_i1:53-1402(-)
MAEQTIASDPASLALFKRVASYPVVQQLYNSARVYYNTAKETNNFVRYGLETAEHKLHEFAEVSKPVLKKLEDPQYKAYLENADQFGCRQLDFIENRVSDAKQALTALSAKKEELLKVSSLKSAVDVSSPAIQQTAQLVKSTVNSCLASTENFVDRVLPESEGKTKDADSGNEEPVFLRVLHLGSKVSTRVGSQLSNRFSNLKLRSVEDVKNYAYVNLIEYAKYMDSYLPANAQLSTLKEKVEPVRQQASVYASNLSSRLHELLQHYEKNPAAAPYVNFVRSLNVASLRKQLPELLSRFQDLNLKYATQLKTQVLSSPFSHLVYNNITSSLAYAKYYFEHVEKNPTVAHGIELARNYVAEVRERAQVFLNSTQKTTSVVVEEVKEELVPAVQAAKEEVDKKAEELEKVEANGNHTQQAAVVENNEVPQADDEEEGEEGEEGEEEVASSD